MIETGGSARFLASNLAKNTAAAVKRFVRRFRSTVRTIDDGAAVHREWRGVCGFPVSRALGGALHHVLDTFSVKLPPIRDAWLFGSLAAGRGLRVIGQET